jgi:hypothetical protein
MAHAQKPDFVFQRKGRVHLNRQARQFSRLLTAEACGSAVVMLDTPSSEVVWRVLATHSIRQFPLHFPSRASPCAITYQLDSIYNSYLHFKYTIPDPFRYFVICSIFLQKVFIPCPVQDLAGSPSSVHVCVFSRRTISWSSSAKCYQWSRHAAVTRNKIVR